MNSFQTLCLSKYGTDLKWQSFFYFLGRGGFGDAGFEMDVKVKLLVDYSCNDNVNLLL